MVPIRWKEPNGEEKEYYVGFQVDVRMNVCYLAYARCSRLVAHPWFFLSIQLNEALENTSERPHSAAVPRRTVDYNEPRGPGDETWAET